MNFFFGNAVSTVTMQYHLLFVIWWCKTPTFSCWCQNNKWKLRNPDMHCYIFLNIDMKIDITHNFVEYNPLILWQRYVTDRYIAWSSKLLYMPSAMSFNKDVSTGTGSSTRYIPITRFPRLVLWKYDHCNSGSAQQPQAEGGQAVPPCTKQSLTSPISPKLPNVFHCFFVDLTSTSLSVNKNHISCLNQRKTNSSMGKIYLICFHAGW